MTYYKLKIYKIYQWVQQILFCGTIIRDAGLKIKMHFASALEYAQDNLRLSQERVIAIAGLLLVCTTAFGQFALVPPERMAMNSLQKNLHLYLMRGRALTNWREQHYIFD